MRNFLKITLLIGSATLLFGCGGSKFGSDKDVTTAPQVPDAVTPFSPTTEPTFTTQHCGDISGQQHQFYGVIKNPRNREQFAAFLETQGICRRGINSETENCNFWNQQTIGVTIAFFRGFPQQASIQIDATGNGFPNNGALPGFSVRSAQLGGQINCAEEDLSINAWTPNNGLLQIVAPNRFGNKNAPDMRMSLYFNGAILGTQFLRRQ